MDSLGKDPSGKGTWSQGEVLMPHPQISWIPAVAHQERNKQVKGKQMDTQYPNQRCVVHIGLGHRGIGTRLMNLELPESKSWDHRVLEPLHIEAER